jgi:hypothetical protein
MRQESAKNSDAFFAALARRTQLLPITCRLFRPPEEEASPEARRKMPPSGDDFVARMPTSPGKATSANFLEGLFPSTAPSYHHTASPPSPAQIKAAASSTSSFDQEGKRAGHTYIQRQVALLSSDLMWEVHMRRQAAEYLRESQRKNAQSRVEGANMQALQASVARLQEDNKRLTEELHRERQSVNNFQISKREWEDKLQKKINRNGEEKARMVEQLGEAQRIAQDLTVVNQKLKEEAAQRALHVMQLQCDIVKLSEARKDVTEMKVHISFTQASFCFHWICSFKLPRILCGMVTLVNVLRGRSRAYDLDHVLGGIHLSAAATSHATSLRLTRGHFVGGSGPIQEGVPGPG